MYSESDLAAAVEAGVLTPEAADAFRNHIAETRSAPAVDEEHFKLLTGFNDIFVAIAAALMLVAVGWIGAYIGGHVFNVEREGPVEIGATIAAGGFSVAIVSWLLAEYFTRQRRMALPSILLLMGFAGGIFTGVSAIFGANTPWLAEKLGIAFQDETGMKQLMGSIAIIVGVVTAIATWIHWRRFMVPITVAVGAVALVTVAVGAIMAFVPGSEDWLNAILLAAGLIVFTVAMRWDMSDLERRTRRSDVAFWLHLAAAPLIAHPVFHMLGVFDHDVGLGMAAVVLALYVAFAFIALAVDRRALLVSSLVYVLWAMYALFQMTGAVELSAALTALVIGSALLMLSAFWQPMRRSVVGLLGGLRESLPPTAEPAFA
ncbi:hypothetical protein P1X14_08320 [Sphingomonas sp. AOB5]|uniref:hypothetical protein n=1 Tax=Sphingomonas sp. AOB5 TaxID=3034017 RepID=UPI0023F63B43|nr:hypothetical protein [Sphingomonas sp. AOB5]MDF7775248.1 hypothetical protein [Sphingomonas sp. AOB5]